MRAALTVLLLTLAPTALAEEWPCPDYTYSGSKIDRESGNHYQWRCEGRELRVDGRNPKTYASWHTY